MIHLADQRDGSAEDDRADTRAKIGEHRTVVTGKPAAETIGGEAAGQQYRNPQQPCQLRPVRGNEGKERGGNQQPADDCNDDRDGDAGNERPKRPADGSDDLRRDHAIGLPLRKISLEALPIGSVKHHRASPVPVPAVASREVRRRAISRHGAPSFKNTFRRRTDGLPLVEPTYHRSGCIGTACHLLTAGAPIRLETRRGAVEVKVRSDRDVPENMVFMPFCYAEAAANLLTNPALDRSARFRNSSSARSGPKRLRCGTRRSRRADPVDI